MILSILFMEIESFNKSYNKQFVRIKFFGIVGWIQERDLLT